MTWKLRVVILVVAVALAGCSRCGGSGDGAGGADGAGGGGDSAAPPGDSGAQADRTGSKVLLVAQSTFARSEKGRWTVPDAGKLLILRPTGSGWSREEIVDRDSNVFHKGLVLAGEAEGAPRVLTIGGNKAILRLWRRGGSGWEHETLWEPVFGGTHNRLRDAEVADVTGDGRQDIVLATHDQGVTAVVRRTESGWEPMELARTADTFVHEVEVGDVDGDGRPEIYATPSRPNLGQGGAQPGKVVRFTWTGEGFEQETVVALERRHAKEILVADLTGDGRPELYAALEAETEASEALGGRVVHPVEIVRYSRGEGGAWTGETVATIEDRQCRFLVAGDLDGDGSAELVAAAMTTGVWMFDPGDSLPWPGRSLERDTGGFEHATLLADIDGDGALELYVADDSHGRLVRYRWSSEGSGGLSEPELLATRTVPQAAITWNLWVADLPPAP